MGIVIRQSFWSSIAAYIGVGIGYLNVVILMPKYFTPEEIGLYRTIMSTAALLAPIPLFGLKSSFLRFFARNTEKQNETLVFLGSIVFGLLSAVLIGLAVLFKPMLLNFYSEKAAILNEYLWLTLLLIFLTGCHSLLEAILQAKKDIAIPSFIRETLLKFMQASAVVLVGLAIFKVHTFLVFQSAIYLILIIITFYFVSRKFNFQLSVSREQIQESNYKEVFVYARYALLSGLGTVAVIQIDQIMISRYIGLEANAIYTTAIFMAVVIELPRKFIMQITQPVITEDFKANRLDKIHDDYKKASINMLILGSYIFLGIVVNLPNIYTIMPNGDLYRSGISIVYIIGLAKLVNMVFSTNGEIIVMSNYYRVNIFLIASLGLMTIMLNILLIPRYGIEGAAYASLLTFFLFNLFKFLFVKIKFSFSPFSKWTIPTILLIPLFLFINSKFSYAENPWIDILVRSSALSIGFFLFLILGKPSKELLNIIRSIFKKIGLTGL
ncbi:lipopolysaccharide biosynthesis protein [Ekhidna sp.]